MKLYFCLITLLAPVFGQPAAPTSQAGVPVRMVVTVEPKAGAQAQLSERDVMAYQNNHRIPATEFHPLGPDRAGLQLWILIDDGDATALGTQIADIKGFIVRQPAAEEIGVGYIQNGFVRVAQDLTTDHQAAQNSLRLPLGIPGISASPYLGIASLIKKWPASDHPREVLLVSSGIDPDFGDGYGNPYLSQAEDAAVRAHVIVHAIWFRSAGHIGHSFALMNWGQIYLSQLTEDTGGEFFWEGTINPVSFSPYFDRLDRELNEQYLLTVVPKTPSKPSFEKIRIGAEVPGVSLVGPQRIWVDSTASPRQTG